MAQAEPGNPKRGRATAARTPAGDGATTPSGNGAEPAATAPGTTPGTPLASKPRATKRRSVSD